MSGIGTNRDRRASRVPVGLRSAVRSLFPRPDRRFSWRSVWPLGLFLAVFVGVVLWLEWSGRILFGEPWAFALLILAPWVWWVSAASAGGLTRGRAAAAAFVRLSLVGLCVAALAEPRAVRTRDVTSVVYAVDLSDSVGDLSGEEALEFFAATVAGKPAGDEAGLLVFGRTAAVELPPRMSLQGYEGWINSQVERDATNLEQTLSLAAAVLPEENRGRVVLISDGTETEGNLSSVVDELKAKGIAVDVLPVEYAFDREVWLERLELPRFVRLGESYEASVVLSSVSGGAGDLVLRENGEEVAREPVEYRAGKNRFTFPIRLRDAGYYEYAATIEPRDTADGEPGDNLDRNNTALNYVYLEGEGKVLLVTDPGGDPREWEDLTAALVAGERDVRVVDGFQFPRDVLSLLPYDLVIFANVPADVLDAVQQRSVRDAVHDLGVGFLMVGGPNSFGAGGYHNTPVEEALPVDMDITKRKVLPKGALAIILHTCEFPEGNTWGKRIAKQAVRVLGAEDEVGILAADFGVGETWIVDMTPAGNYDAIATRINAAQIGDMPSFAGTMGQALAALKESDAAAKHVIIISDGDPSPPAPGQIKSFQDEQISVSTVAVFPHGGQEVSVMQGIAKATNGNFYFPDDPNSLPGIFIKEAKTLKRTLIQNKTVLPELAMSHPLLAGLSAPPPLHGYVLTTAKGGLDQTLLVTPSDARAAPGEYDPILAVQQFGLGRTGAFTGDLSPKWGRDWLAWDDFRPFVRQLVTHLARVERQGHLRMSTYTDGSDGVVVVEDFHPNERFLEVRAKVAGPRERTESVALAQVGPRRYQVRVPLWGKGRYQVVGAGVAGGSADEGGGTERVTGGFILPYSPEYLRFRSNPIVLEDVARRTGGRVLSAAASADQIYREDRQPKSSSRPVFDWLLVALACLVPLDVAVRRVQLDWATVKAWFGREEKVRSPDATLGSLLAKKQEVGARLDRGAKPERPAPRPTSRAPLAVSQRPAKPRAEQITEQKSESGDAPVSTTEALLALKKKRRDP